MGLDFSQPFLCAILVALCALSGSFPRLYGAMQGLWHPMLKCGYGGLSRYSATTLADAAGGMVSGIPPVGLHNYLSALSG